jgi:uncharacterized protein (DUF58 family)
VSAPARLARTAFAPSLTYALRWRVGGVIPGAHPGSDSGQSGRFRQVVPFDRSPDPRRIDLRATLRDPFERLHVRQFEQRASARVEVLLDVSASMAFGLRHSNFSLAAELAAAVAEAAHEIHDAFGLAACAEAVEFVYPARRGDPKALLDGLASMRPRGASARGLLAAAERLVGRRKLVFVVSDFAFPLETLSELLDVLSAHDVVPVQVTDELDCVLPAWGLAELADLENGRRRLVMLRPALCARWRRQAALRKAQIASLCLARGRRPFVLDGTFDTFAFAEYLLGT